MGKDSALSQLMGVRMNGVMNGISSSDGNIRQSYGNLTNTPADWKRWNCRRKSSCLLIDRYVSEHLIPARLFQLQGHVFGKMPANRSKRNEHTNENPCLQLRYLFLNLLQLAAEYLLRCLVVHPHVKERLAASLLFFQPFLYDGFIPQDFRLLHPHDAAPKHQCRTPHRLGSSKMAWRTFCAIVYIFQSCTSDERQTPLMLKPFLSLAAMVPSWSGHFLSR